MLRTSLVAALLAGSAIADVVTVPGSRDNTLFNDPAGLISNGQGPIAIVGRAGGMSGAPVRRALYRFDLASHVPAGATILSARLELVFTTGNTGPRNVELHRVLADWGEGASNSTTGQGAPAQSGDATWLHRFFASTPWAAQGGDFDATASAVLVVDQFGLQAWPSTPQAVADVQGWLDAPATNFGWLLKLDLESVPQTTKVFATREDSDPASHPRLVIEFDPPPIYAYCTAQTASIGCVPSIGSSGVPSASAGSGFVLSLASAMNRKSGLLCYGLSGQDAQPFLGGTLCVAPPTRRTPLSSSGGSAAGDDCSGSLALDFNARIASGVDPALVAGAVVFSQWFTRDPGNTAGSFCSSDALRFEIAP